MLIDSHSHIDGAEFQLDIDEVFARMKEAEVGGALVAGTSLQDYERGLNSPMHIKTLVRRRRSSEYQG